MELALIGLGKMGANMARRLVRGGHRVVGFDRDFSVAETLQAEIGLTAVRTLSELTAFLSAPRTAWVMVPAGDAAEAIVAELAELFAPGDAIIDGGNTFYKDDIRRAAALKEKGIHYVDVGTSGGVWGLKSWSAARRRMFSG